MTEELFYYCYYHIYNLKGVHYHHVIIKIKTEDLSLINTYDEHEYQYKLISAQAVYLDEQQQAEVINRGLIMDGESLLSKIKNAQRKLIKKTKDESC